MPDSEYQESYPKWMYAKRDGAVVSELVRDPRARAALGKGWAESPAGPFQEETPKSRPKGRSRTRS